MIETEVRSNAAEVAVRYDKAPALISTTLVKVLRRIGAGLERHVKREKLQGQVLTRRTGTLMRAIYTKILLEASARDAVLVLGADTKKAAGARLQEYGGVVVPRNAQYLTIPLDAARTSAGVARLSASEFIRNPQALGFDHSFVNKRKTVIMGARDVGGETVAEPVFALKKRVVIPERSYLRSSVRDRKAAILQELGLGTKEAVTEALTT